MKSKLLRSLGTKYIIVHWSDYTDLPEISHLPILTDPRKFYETLVNDIEIIYNSRELSIFKIF